MKKLLLATTFLAGTAGVAAAEVSFSGNAYIGLSNAFDVASNEYEGTEGDFEFITRVRLIVSMSGETDSGLTFGAGFESQNAGMTDYDTGAGEPTGGAGRTANSDTQGNATAYIAGSFGKITFGDVGDASDNLIGNVDGVGLNLEGAKWNELGYIGNDKTAVKYEGTFGDFSVTVGLGQLDANNDGADDQDMSVAVKYSFGDFAVYAGYAVANAGAETTEATIGADATFGNFTVKLRAQDNSAEDNATYALSATGKFDAISVTAYYADKDTFTAYGIGGAYDLGGGASFKAGVAQADGLGAPTDEAVIDMGLSFSF